ncbi:MAG: [LysW]-lysine hydrolase [Anaerolineales bacterium]
MVEFAPTRSEAALLDERERLIHDLVSIPSPSGDEATAALFLAHWMGDHGMRAYVDRTNSVVGIRGEGETDIVLLGHIDTVPGEIPVRVDGRVLYGRGSVDAKGPLAAFIIAATQVEPPSGTRVIVIGATGEETDSRGARNALKIFQPKACLIGEPSSWDRITLGYKGHLMLRWVFTGALAHSAAPLQTPAECAFRFWQEVQRYEDDFNRDRPGVFDRLDASLRSLNTHQRGCYGQADMQLVFRLPPDLPLERLENDLRALNGTARLEFSRREVSHVAEKNTFLTRALLQAIRSNGGRPRFVNKTGTSDMNIVAPVWNCPIAAYGPGDSSLDHTPQEHLDLNEFQRSIDVVRLTLEKLLQECCGESKAAFDNSDPFR